MFYICIFIALALNNRCSHVSIMIVHVKSVTTFRFLVSIHLLLLKIEVDYHKRTSICKYIETLSCLRSSLQHGETLTYVVALCIYFVNLYISS